jgi:HK97 family phage major capsid protein
MQRTNPVESHMRALMERSQAATKVTAGLAGLADRSTFVDSLLYRARVSPHEGGARLAEDFSAAVGHHFSRPARGLWIPFAGLMRDLTVGTPADGGYLVSPRHTGELGEALRPFSALVGRGAQVVAGLADGNMILPTISEGAGVTWINEGGSPSESDPQFEQVVVTPRSLHASVICSRRLVMNQSSRAGLEAALFGELARAIWSEVDRVALAGSGVAPEPLGILNDAGVPVVAAGPAGAEPTWELLTEMERVFGANYASLNPPSWVTNSAVRKKLRNTPRATDLDFCWPDDNRMLGYDAAVTEHSPGDLTKGTGTDLSALALGDFSSVVIGVWGPAAIDVLLDPYTYGTQGKMILNAYLDVGIGFRHKNAFVRCGDLVTA